MNGGEKRRMDEEGEGWMDEEVEGRMDEEGWMRKDGRERG